MHSPDSLSPSPYMLSPNQVYYTTPLQQFNPHTLSAPYPVTYASVQPSTAGASSLRQSGATAYQLQQSEVAATYQFHQPVPLQPIPPQQPSPPRSPPTSSSHAHELNATAQDQTRSPVAPIARVIRERQIVRDRASFQHKETVLESPQENEDKEPLEALAFFDEDDPLAVLAEKVTGFFGSLKKMAMSGTQDNTKEEKANLKTSWTGRDDATANAGNMGKEKVHKELTLKEQQAKDQHIRSFINSLRTPADIPPVSGLAPSKKDVSLLSPVQQHEKSVVVDSEHEPSSILRSATPPRSTTPLTPHRVSVSAAKKSRAMKIGSIDAASPSIVAALREKLGFTPLDAPVPAPRKTKVTHNVTAATWDRKYSTASNKATAPFRECDENEQPGADEHLPWQDALEPAMRRSYFSIRNTTDLTVADASRNTLIPFRGTTAYAVECEDSPMATKEPYQPVRRSLLSRRKDTTRWYTRRSALPAKTSQSRHKRERADSTSPPRDPFVLPAQSSGTKPSRHQTRSTSPTEVARAPPVRVSQVELSAQLIAWNSKMLEGDGAQASILSEKAADSTLPGMKTPPRGDQSGEWHLDSPRQTSLSLKHLVNTDRSSDVPSPSEPPLKADLKSAMPLESAQVVTEPLTHDRALMSPHGIPVSEVCGAPKSPPIVTIDLGQSVGVVGSPSINHAARNMNLSPVIPYQSHAVMPVGQDVATPGAYEVYAVSQSSPQCSTAMPMQYEMVGNMVGGEVLVHQVMSPLVPHVTGHEIYQLYSTPLEASYQSTALPTQSGVMSPSVSADVLVHSAANATGDSAAGTTTPLDQSKVEESMRFDDSTHAPTAMGTSSTAPGPQQENALPSAPIVDKNRTTYAVPVPVEHCPVRAVPSEGAPRDSSDSVFAFPRPNLTSRPLEYNRPSVPSLPLRASAQPSTGRWTSRAALTSPPLTQVAASAKSFTPRAGHDTPLSSEQNNAPVACDSLRAHPLPSSEDSDETIAPAADRSGPQKQDEVSGNRARSMVPSVRPLRRTSSLSRVTVAHTPVETMRAFLETTGAVVSAGVQTDEIVDEPKKRHGLKLQESKLALQEQAASLLWRKSEISTSANTSAESGGAASLVIPNLRDADVVAPQVASLRRASVKDVHNRPVYRTAAQWEPMSSTTRYIRDRRLDDDHTQCLADGPLSDPLVVPATTLPPVPGMPDLATELHCEFLAEGNCARGSRKTIDGDGMTPNVESQQIHSRRKTDRTQHLEERESSHKCTDEQLEELRQPQTPKPVCTSGMLTPPQPLGSANPEGPVPSSPPTSPSTRAEARTSSSANSPPKDTPLVSKTPSFITTPAKDLSPVPQPEANVPVLSEVEPLKRTAASILRIQRAHLASHDGITPLMHGDALDDHGRATVVKRCDVSENTVAPSDKPEERLITPENRQRADTEVRNQQWEADLVNLYKQAFELQHKQPKHEEQQPEELAEYVLVSGTSQEGGMHCGKVQACPPRNSVSSFLYAPPFGWSDDGEDFGSEDALPYRKAYTPPVDPEDPQLKIHPSPTGGQDSGRSPLKKHLEVEGGMRYSVSPALGEVHGCYDVLWQASVEHAARVKGRISCQSSSSGRRLKYPKVGVECAEDSADETSAFDVKQLPDAAHTSVSLDSERRVVDESALSSTLNAILLAQRSPPPTPPQAPAARSPAHQTESPIYSDLHYPLENSKSVIPSHLLSEVHASETKYGSSHDVPQLGENNMTSGRGSEGNRDSRKSGVGATQNPKKTNSTRNSNGRKPKKAARGADITSHQGTAPEEYTTREGRTDAEEQSTGLQNGKCKQGRMPRDVKKLHAQLSRDRVADTSVGSHTRVEAEALSSSLETDQTEHSRQRAGASGSDNGSEAVRGRMSDSKRQGHDGNVHRMIAVVQARESPPEEPPLPAEPSWRKPTWRGDEAYRTTGVVPSPRSPQEEPKVDDEAPAKKTYLVDIDVEDKTDISGSSEKLRSRHIDMSRIDRMVRGGNRCIFYDNNQAKKVWLKIAAHGGTEVLEVSQDSKVLEQLDLGRCEADIGHSAPLRARWNVPERSGKGTIFATIRSSMGLKIAPPHKNFFILCNARCYDFSVDDTQVEMISAIHWVAYLRWMYQGENGALGKAAWRSLQLRLAWTREPRVWRLVAKSQRRPSRLSSISRRMKSSICIPRRGSVMSATA